MADVITRLKLDSGEYDSKIKRATQGLLQMEQECRKVGGTLAVLEKDQLDYVRSLGQMETVSRSARGKVSELTAAFTELSVQYKHLTDEEKKGDYGKALSASLNQLKGRINEAKTELADVDKELKGASDATGDWSGMLNQLGSQLGINTNLLSGLTTGTIATTAAVTAGATAVAMATKAWAEYNDEINRQNTITSVVTGGKGGEDLTMGVRALARTYDVDFRQAIEAANTLMQQFGVSSSEALRLLQDGMQGMIAGDGGKLLAMIQQYAPSFRDAGIEASQLVAIIQNSEGGIFTDQNMSAITMGIKNIRLMTKQTSEALAQLGVDGEEMTRKLNDGSMTIFEAMQQVAEAIENAGSSSQAVGQVMQTVFGRQGSAAGTNLGKAIATLNTNLEETKKQTGELGESFVKLNEANMRLEETMQEIFGMSGWEDMNNLLKTDLANTLSDVLDYMNDIKTAITGIGTADGFEALCDVLDGMVIPKLMGVTTAMRNIKAFMDGFTGGGGGGTLSGIGKGIGASFNSAISSVKGSQSNGFSITTDSNGKVIKATRDGKDVTNEYLKGTTTKPTVTNPVTPKGVGGRKGTPWAPIAMSDFKGLDLSVAPMAVNWGDAYTHDFKKDLKNLKMPEETKTDKTMVGELQKITGGVEGVFSGMQQLGVEIPEGLSGVISGIQGVTTILTSIAAICTVIQTLTTIQTARSAIPFFAHGGIVGKAANGMVVPGNSFSGDNLRMPVVGGGMIGVNSGEVILNESQSGNLVNKLFSQQGGAVDVQPWVDGEKVYLGMNNTLQRKGKGEIVTTSMLRQKGIL